MGNNRKCSMMRMCSLMQEHGQQLYQQQQQQHGSRCFCACLHFAAFVLQLQQLDSKHVPSVCCCAAAVLPRTTVRLWTVLELSKAEIVDF